MKEGTTWLHDIEFMYLFLNLLTRQNQWINSHQANTNLDFLVLPLTYSLLASFSYKPI